MKSLAFCLTLASSLVVHGPAFAEPVTIPVGQTVVGFDLPEGFIQDFEQATDKAFIRGYVRADDPKSDLVTLTVSRNLAGIPSVSTLDFVNFALAAHQAQCGGEFAQEVVNSDLTIAERPAIAIHIGCAKDLAKPAPSSQSILLVAFRGSTDFYALQWRKKAEASDQPPPYDATLWQSRLDVLVASVRLTPLN